MMMTPAYSKDGEEKAYTEEYIKKDQICRDSAKQTKPQNEVGLAEILTKHKRLGILSIYSEQNKDIEQSCCLGGPGLMDDTQK